MRVQSKEDMLNPAPRVNIKGLKGDKMAVKKAEKKTDKKAEKKTKEIRQSAWEKYDKKALDACFALSETYRHFISDCKTERECVDESIRQAEKAGYKNLADLIGKKKKLKAGDKITVTAKSTKGMPFTCNIKWQKDETFNQFKIKITN